MPKNAYLHIPFCKNKCNYCSFVSFVENNTDCVNTYVQTLIDEIKCYYKNELLDTLYLGGGTPSLLDINHIKRLIECFSLAVDSEITLELNPETVDSEYLQNLLNIGINRLSIGVQTFDDNILKTIGRIHSSKKATDIVKLAQDIGFKNISVDFIYGLPGQTRESFIDDLQTAVDLDVEHISLYGLKIEEDCKFYTSPPFDLPDDDMQADMYIDAVNFLNESGYSHYEISNFSKDGFASRHNLNYWNASEYYGFGLAAHGYVNGVRYSNNLTFESYFADFKKKSYEQVLTQKQKFEEAIFLGFRKSSGIDVKFLNEMFSVDFDKLYQNVVSKYLKTGHLLKTQNGYKLSVDGYLLSNIILSDFINC